MTEVSSGSEHLLNQYMDALDQYGLARAEMEAVETGAATVTPEVVEDRVEKARWKFVEARHRYRRRKTLRQLTQARTA